MTDAMLSVIGTIFGTIVGLVGGSVITWWGAVKLADRQSAITKNLAIAERKAIAGIKLRAAFHDELALLRQSGGDACQILETAFNKHLIAITEFSYSITPDIRPSFDKAWQEYHCHECDPRTPYLTQYSPRLGDTNLARENRNLAIRRIEHILSFTQA